MAFMSALPYELPEALDDSLVGTSSKSSAFGNKLTSVLSASYTDSDIRNALRMLDEKRIPNTNQTRRQLRSQAQKETLDLNGDIVRDFGQVAEQLKQVGRTLLSLNQCCEDIRRHVAAARQETDPVLEDAATMFAQRAQFDSKLQLLNSFTNHFIVPDDELSFLSNPSDELQDDFFCVFDKVKGVHADCRVLLGGENQRLGLELMDESSNYLNLAYHKLYRWISREFKNLDFENPQLGANIRRALRAIADRPSLFQGCLDSFVDAREHVLTESFLMALTGSAHGLDHGSTMKPIEYHAHDPLRYVGDMLAWIYSTVVSEREALERLLIFEEDKLKREFESGRKAEPWTLGDIDAFDGLKTMGDLVNRNMTGVAQALRQRLEQVLQNQEDATLLFNIHNLLNFYKMTLSKSLANEAVLLDVLAAVENSSLQYFRNAVADNITSLNAEVTNLPENLQIPEFLEQSLVQLAALLKSCESSLTPAASRTASSEVILTAALDPFMSLCEKMADNAVEPSASIFSMNCLLAVKSTLSPYDSVQFRVRNLNEKLSACSFNLTEYQHSFFLYTSGLHPLLAALAPLDESEESMNKIQAMELFKPQALSTTSQVLDDFLPSALMDAIEGLKDLSDPKIARGITEEAADRFCEDFEYVEDRVAAIDRWTQEHSVDADEAVAGDERNKPVSLRTFFSRTSEEVRLLLS